jgi:hypothetical protein
VLEPEPEDEYDKAEDERVRYNAADVVGADSEEELQIPVVNENERDLTPAPQHSNGKNRHYWLQVKLFQIHDEARQTSILDSIKEALEVVLAIGYIGVQTGRVQHFQHGHRLYYMLLLKQTNKFIDLMYMRCVHCLLKQTSKFIDLMYMRCVHCNTLISLFICTT